MTRKTTRSIIEYLFFLGIGFLLLWLGFRKLDLNEVWNDILKANYGWLVLSLSFALASHVIRALRWNLLINSLGYKTRLSSTFFAVMIGYLANLAFPRLGEVTWPCVSSSITITGASPQTPRHLTVSREKRLSSVHPPRSIPRKSLSLSNTL